MTRDGPTIEITEQSAAVAHRELDILIRRTNAPFDNDVETDWDDVMDAMEPLARARKRIQARLEAAGEARNRNMIIGLAAARQIIDEVAEETGADTEANDPLQDDIFQARDELDDVLSAPSSSDESAESADLDEFDE